MVFSAILKEVREFIADGNDISKLDNDTNLFDSGFFDSLRVINLVLFIEPTYELTLDYEDLTETNLSTVTVISKLSERKLAD